VRDGGELRLEGVKAFCSGAGGLHGALVVARDRDARRVAYVDLCEGVEIDRSWFAAAGMRASESHLVRFHGARVHALLGGPDELLRDPWFGRDAIRTGCDVGRHRRRRSRRRARGARAARARRR
jgi:alkylation response protein AidB-like acyl-CoA dehydrogenase